MKLKLYNILSPALVDKFSFHVLIIYVEDEHNPQFLKVGFKIVAHPYEVYLLATKEDMSMMENSTDVFQTFVNTCRMTVLDVQDVASLDAVKSTETSRVQGSQEA